MEQELEYLKFSRNLRNLAAKLALYNILTNI